MNFIEFLDQVLLDSISVILVLERGVIIESLSLADFVMIKSEILEIKSLCSLLPSSVVINSFENLFAELINLTAL